MRRRRHSGPDLPLPKRPFRDSVLFYGALALIVVLVAWLTDGRLWPGDLGEKEYGAVPVAIIFFVVATAWSWWRFRKALAAKKTTAPPRT